MSRRWQRVLILSGLVIGVAIVALLALIAYVLLSGDDGADTEVGRVSPTATRTPTATLTPRATPSPTAPLATPSGQVQQPTSVVTVAPGEATPPAAGQPAPSPAAPAPTPQPATPTPAAACPGSPGVASFTANPGTITAGQSSTLSWGPVTNTAHVVIDQGIGEVGGYDSRVVTPPTTTTYTLTASGCGGTTTLQATVIVNPAAQPTPSPTLPPPTPTEQAPPPGGGSWHILTADLAVTGLNADSLPQGKVWVTIANNGPDSLVNISVTLGCSGNAYYLQGGGSIQIATVPWTINVSLEPGWSNTFDTTISVDTTQASYELGCGIEVGFKDDNPANNSLGNVWFPPP